MFTLTKKLQGFRKQLRKKEIQQQIASLRYNQQLYLQQLEYEQSGDYGTVLLHSIYQKSQNIQNCQLLLRQYPLKSMYFLLESTFDNTTHQSFAIKIFENYFYHGISKNPQQEMVDNLLRILQLRNSSLKLILLILYAIIQDNSEYTLFLIKSKKYIQILCRINEAYSNNSQIRYLIIRIWHILSKISSWNISLIELINPLMALANFTESKQIPFIIQTIVNIAKLCPQKIVQKIYKKGILRLCDIYARKFRSVSLHYLNIFYLSSAFVIQTDIEAIISFIFDHSTNNVAYEEYILCPSNQSISEMSLQLLKEMITITDTQMIQIISKIIQSRKILQKLGAMCIQNVKAEQDLYILLSFLQIYLRNQSLRPQQIKQVESLIHKIEIKLASNQQICQQQPPLTLVGRQNDMQIEQDQKMI